jgi:hypothetical protein
MKRGWVFIAMLVLGTGVACGANEGEAESIAYSEDFSVPAGWHTSSDPEVDINYHDGGLGIEIKVIDRVAWSVAGRSVTDGVVSVDATPVGGPDDNAYGIVARHVDDRSFYRFEISADGYYAIQAPTGSLGWEFLVDWTESQAIHRGRETNRLRVELNGPTMTFWVNDVELATVSDERYTEGDVGVIAGTFYDEPGTHVLFDNFSVEPLPKE